MAIPAPTRPSAPTDLLDEMSEGRPPDPVRVIDLRVAQRIRARRLKSGMTLQTLAERIGVAFQQAHKYERGQSRISAGRLYHIARALRAPINYFFLPEEEAKAAVEPAASAIRQRPRFLCDRRGATAALFAVLLTALFGFAGLGVDVGIWYSLRRQFQSAVDNAALSGALELADGKGTYVSGTPTGPATADMQSLALYAAQNDGVSSTTATTVGCTAPAANQLCVNNPPLYPGGQHVGDPYYVEAILAQPGISIFPGLVGYGNAITVTTRAVAGMTHPVPSCFIGLGSPSYGTGNTLSIGGGGNNANLQIPNCAFVSASLSPASATTNASIYLNGNITIVAGAVDTSGGYVIKGNSASVTPPIVPNFSPQFTDPYCDVTETSGCPTTGAVITLSSTSGYPWLAQWPAGSAEPVSNPSVGWAPATPKITTCSPSPGTLVPGWYACSGAGLTLSGTGTFTLCPGVYFIDGESTTGNNKGAGVLISGSSTTVNVGQAGTAYNGVTCPSNNGVSKAPLGADGVSVMNGVTFIASCSTSGCTAGGGLVIGGQGSNSPTVNLSAPRPPTGCVATPSTPCSGPACWYQSVGPSPPAGTWINACPGIPASVLFHQVYNTADSNKGNTSFGNCTPGGTDAGGNPFCINGVIHVPATSITLGGSAQFGGCSEMIAANFILQGGAQLGRLSNCQLQVDNARTVALAE